MIFENALIARDGPGPFLLGANKETVIMTLAPTLLSPPLIKLTDQLVNFHDGTQLDNTIGETNSAV